MIDCACQKCFLVGRNRPDVEATAALIEVLSCRAVDNNRSGHLKNGLPFNLKTKSNLQNIFFAYETYRSIRNNTMKRAVIQARRYSVQGDRYGPVASLQLRANNLPLAMARMPCKLADLAGIVADTLDRRHRLLFLQYLV